MTSIEETWELEFAWLREKAPSARTITVHEEYGGDWKAAKIRVVTLQDATDEDRVRVVQALAIRAPWFRWDVRRV